MVMVHGQIYHQTGHMHPSEDSNRLYAQLYVIDSHLANQQRINHPANQRLNPHIVAQLDEIIRRDNVYVHAYRMLREIEIEAEERATAEAQTLPVVNMAFRRDRNNDRRHYSLLTVDEIAMIFQSADGEPPFERDFRVYPRNPQQPLITLNILSPHLDPMVYVLFYPVGEAGWQPNMEINHNNCPNRQCTRITMLQWKVAQSNSHLTRSPMSMVIHCIDVAKTLKSKSGISPPTIALLFRITNISQRKSIVISMSNHVSLLKP